MRAKQPEMLNSQEVPITLIHVHMPSSRRLLITLTHVHQAAMNAEQQKLSITLIHAHQNSQEVLIILTHTPNSQRLWTHVCQGAMNAEQSGIVDYRDTRARSSHECIYILLKSLRTC